MSISYEEIAKRQCFVSSTTVAEVDQGDYGPLLLPFLERAATGSSLPAASASRRRCAAFWNAC